MAAGTGARGRLAWGPWWARTAGSVDRVERAIPAWLRPTRGENRLPVAFAILLAAGLQLSVPAKYGLHPRWLAPLLEILLLAVLTAINPIRLERTTPLARWTGILAVAAITVDNVFSAGLLDLDIVRGKVGDNAIGLLASGAAIYLTNVIAFGIWYWELDRGGPFARAAGATPHPDFLFPQMANTEFAPDDWEPRFADYLYVSFTNVVAFSPTDTMPLTVKVKSLMTVQSAVALSTTALVVARAVNILK